MSGSHFKNIFFLLLSVALLMIACRTTEELNPVEEPPTTAVEESVAEKNDTDEAVDYEDASETIESEAPRAVEGRAKSHPPAAKADMMMAKSRHAAEGVIITRPDGTPQHAPEAGQLTAGEWNHLDKWDQWKDLLANKDYNEMQEHWKVFPRSRYSVFLRNQYELPIQDARVELYNAAKELIWTARTDNAGKAELWADLNQQQKSFDTYHAVVTVNDSKYTLERLTDIEHGVNKLDINVPCASAKNVDIMWAVDATGSMGDEIRYLQTELEDVISRSLKGEKLNIRMGSVFYRDTKDDYLTRVQPLGKDEAQTLVFIKEQSADGGGDYPEAVESALEDCLAQDWSEDAIARIIFLVLDAPPHHNPQVLTQLQEQIKEAAERGIKIIPVTASGINRQTEFLMKFMAIATNGTYVFITDHSGIGNPHLKPVVQDFEVEKLNDLIVRLLYHYTKSNGCDANEAGAKKVDIKLYPNPTSNYVTISTPDDLTTVKVLSNSGRAIITKTNIGAGELRLELDGLVDGIYTVQCIGDSYEHNQPLIVVNG